MKTTPPVIIGQKGAFAQPVQFGRDDSGSFQRYSFEGTTREVLQVAESLDLGGWVYTFTELHGGRSKVEARSGWGNFKSNYDPAADVENIWELEQQDTTKPLLAADFPFSFTSGLNDLNLNSYISSSMNSDKTRDALADMVGIPGGYWQDSALTFNTPSNYPSYTFDDGLGGEDSEKLIHLPTADYAAAKSLYYLIKGNTDSFQIEASIIRHSQLVSNLYSRQASYSNVNRIISPASMISVEGTPSGLLFQIPPSPAAIQFIETPGDLQYGWRKVRPNVTRLAAYKWRIQQNYQYGQWPLRLYGGVI